MTANANILVVDDDRVVRNASSRLLESAGYQVLMAGSGQEALDVMQHYRPDLILLDIDMPPGMDGFEVCRRIKSEPKWGNICVVFISGARSDIDSKVDGFGIGADEYIVRPISSRELLARVQAMLRIHAAEQALQIIVAQWSSAFDAVHEAMFLTDMDNNILRCNRAAEQFFRRASVDMLGKTCQSIFYEDNVELSKAAAGSFYKNDQYETLTIFREARWLEVSVDPVPGLHGNNNGYVYVVADITERKQSEAELRDYNLRLEKSNLDLADFAYVASHDLQEPLRKILAFSDRLGSKYQGLLDEIGRDYLARMQDAARRMQTLINDLLTISRANTEPQNIAYIDLTVIARQVISDMETYIEKNNGQIQLDVLPTIEADASQMYQLLQNLISNAVKFHATGQPPQVKISSESAGDDLCRIFVTDNGIGFDIQSSDRIFKPFQRLVDRSSYEGSGMGLAICRRIVDRHHGDITVTSILGKGSSFIITLPVLQNLPGKQ